jgi:hypothetical protein
MKMAELQFLRADRADIDAYRTQPFLTFATFLFVQNMVSKTRKYIGRFRGPLTLPATRQNSKMAEILITSTCTPPHFKKFWTCYEAGFDYHTSVSLTLLVRVFFSVMLL